ncbi:transposase-like protein [Paenibacillus mucilaginosus 3016]|uniref:Transposase-like protein n=1 Tax=Paenibacillus mucilaginosus 3016 TaxID=1116391 RepID=H6NA76_9BACL|nr:transposase-like protein [Paenibacillus mucilaginosus 3016]
MKIYTSCLILFLRLVRKVDKLVSIMEVLIERACGLDVHKKSITACIVTPEGKEIKTFRTHTVFLLELIDWIKEHRCTHVAMESILFLTGTNAKCGSWFDIVEA